MTHRVVLALPLDLMRPLRAAYAKYFDALPAGVKARTFDEWLSAFIVLCVRDGLQ